MISFIKNCGFTHDRPPFLFRFPPPNLPDPPGIPATGRSNQNVWKKVAKLKFGIDIAVRFVRAPGACAAQYGDRTLTVNMAALGSAFYNDPRRMIALTIHEIAHEVGLHCDIAYHEAICDIGALLLIKARDEPEFYEVK